MAHFFTSDTALSETRILQYFVPRFLFEDEKLQTHSSTRIRTVLLDKLNTRFDMCEIILLEGHLGAVSPPVVHILGQVGAACDHFAIDTAKQ